MHLNYGDREKLDTHLALDRLSHTVSFPKRPLITLHMGRAILMTNKRNTEKGQPSPPELLIDREEAKQRISERINKGLELKQSQTDSRETFELLSNEFNKWNAFNIELLKRIFTTEQLADEYSYWGIAFGFGEQSLREKIAEKRKDIDSKIHRLDSIIERLELIPISASKTISSEVPTATPRTKKVFVVHGRDEVAKTNLEVFLHEIGLEPIVLHRQADEGQTIIEKFERHSDVGYAFILLTPDEIAYLSNENGLEDAERRKEFRARPNVIFEFGYFVGKLGRSKVCCLYTGEVALPSDVSGMIYKRYHNSIEEVAYSIIKDLKASGFSVK